MNSNKHPFNFDANFSLGTESVFTDVFLDYSKTITPPPERGYFLLLNGGRFLFLNGQAMTLL